MNVASGAGLGSFISDELRKGEPEKKSILEGVNEFEIETRSTMSRVGETRISLTPMIIE